MKLICKLFFSVFTFAAINVQAQIPQLDGLEEFVEEVMAFEKTPGAAIAVVQGDKVVYSKGFGVQEAGRSDLVDGDTIFAIGSNTKYFTAVAVGLLVEEGKLDWDAPLTKYLPKLRFSDSYLFTEVSLRDALSHRTGLSRSDFAWYVNSGQSRDQMLEIIEQLPRELSFRSGYLYNNFLYVAAGEAIPAVADSSWDDVVRERIFSPLQMNRSSTSVSSLKGRTNVAIPHTVVNDKPISRPYYNMDHIGPAGSINSSANDMAQWCKAQLGNGAVNGEQIIPPAVINDVRQPHNLLPLAKEGHSATVHAAYALGVSRSNYGNYTSYSHGGRIDGMISNFTFIPDADLCVVVLTNSDSGYGLYSAASKWIFDHMLGLSDKEKDYLGDYKKRAEMIKAHQNNLKKAHTEIADSNVKPTVALAAFEGTYSKGAYGDLFIKHIDGELHFEYGSVLSGVLAHHRGDSFDVVSDSEVRNAIKPNLSFSVDGSGVVQSVMVDFIGQYKERFFKQQPKK